MSGDHVQPTLGLCMSFKNCSQLIRSLWLTSAKDSRQTPVEMGEVAALDMGSAKTSKRSFWFVWRLGTPKTCCLIFNFPIKIAYLGTVPPRIFRHTCCHWQLHPSLHFWQTVLRRCPQLLSQKRTMRMSTPPRMTLPWHKKQNQTNIQL
jgi:hypothetical protein